MAFIKTLEDLLEYVQVAKDATVRLQSIQETKKIVEKRTNSI